MAQCAAITQKGERCKRNAAVGKKKCTQHSSTKSPVKTKKPSPKKVKEKPKAKKTSPKPLKKMYEVIDEDDGIIKIKFKMSGLEFVNNLKDREFQKMLLKLFKNVPFSQYFWECMPITNSQKNFEFVIVETEHLSDTVDKKPFASELKKCVNLYICNFKNLAGDSELFAPMRPYPHIAEFFDTASDDEVFELFTMLSRKLKMANKPCWLSTSGLAVKYLHVRIDPEPKYYHYSSYKK